MDDIHVYFCDGVLTIALNRPSNQNGITLQVCFTNKKARPNCHR